VSKAPGVSKAWTPAKTATFRRQFERFLGHISISSKELGNVCLGDHLYDAQNRLLDAIFAGLADDVHDFKIGKSRQLGITTLSRALTLFWAGVHPGLRGYFVTYDGKALEEARIELRQMADSLPPSLGFPKFRASRDRWVLENDTVIMFAAAGTKRNASTGTLGRGSGINFVHASEVSSWGSDEQIESFRNGLAMDFPDRFYLWESTARGYNLWHQMWENAKEDTTRQRTIFLGWWTKNNQRIPRKDEAFAKYGEPLPTDKELERIHEVRKHYGYLIQPEQLAWYRRQMDPALTSLSADAAALDEDPMRVQENPWTEWEMFQATGSTFFSAERLTLQQREFVRAPKTLWQYDFGTEFTDTTIRSAESVRSIELKVWDEPEEKNAVYIVSADPAGGASEHGDRSCVHVARAFADGLDQVAEYAWTQVGTQHFAWVIASLLGHYTSSGNDVYFILEINGPGEAVLKEMRALKAIIERGYLRPVADEMGLTNILSNVKNFFWSRADALHPSNNTVHWKTSFANKKPIMERLRDFVHSGLIHIRSAGLVDELRTMTQDGDSVEAAGGKNDDRVIAAALAVRCWEDRVRIKMSNARRTRAAEDAKQSLTMAEMTTLFMEHQMDGFFAAKRGQRAAVARVASRQKWRERQR
jgi:hypothetical protein